MKENTNPMQQGKLVVAGTSGAGKSSLIIRFTQNYYNDRITATLTSSYSKKDYQVDSKNVQLCIWDTAGQERFMSVSPMYFRSCQFALLVFDLTDLQSFKAINFWKEQVEQKSSTALVYLVGNKKDLVATRKVTQEIVDQFLKLNPNMKYFEISVKENLGIKELFDDVGRAYLKDLKEGTEVASRQGIDLKDETKKKSGCC